MHSTGEAVICDLAFCMSAAEMSGRTCPLKAFACRAGGYMVQAAVSTRYVFDLQVALFAATALRQPNHEAPSLLQTYDPLLES